MLKIITIQEAEVLIKKYYDGGTSRAEEKLLHRFLSRKQLPEQFEADKAVLGYFVSQRKKKKLRTVPILRWTSGAAAAAAGIMLFHFLMPGVPDSYAYIDGRKITNIEQVKQQARASIQSWNESENNTDLDTNELIHQQLQLFIK